MGELGAFLKIERHGVQYEDPAKRHAMHQLRTLLEGGAK